MTVFKMAPFGQGCYQKGIWPFAPIERNGTFHKKGTFVKRAIVEKNNTGPQAYFSIESPNVLVKKGYG